MTEEIIKRYSQLPDSIHKYSDPLVRLGYKTAKSKSVSKMRKKGDDWIAHKKSIFGKKIKKR